MLLRALHSLPQKLSNLLRPLCLLGISSALISVAAPVCAAALSPRVEQALKAGQIGPEALSVAIIPLTGNGTPVYLNADNPVNPASTMKLVTTYAALELLGPTYQWKTAFYTDGTLKNGVLQGNLYLKGGGDPKLTMERFWLLLRELRNAGVQDIRGDLILERSYFHPGKPELSFEDDSGDDTKAYLVEPDALMVNLKMLRLIVRGDTQRAVIQTDPPMPYISIDNRIKVTPATTTCPDWPAINYSFQPQANGHLTILANGQIPDGCSAQRYLSLLDHPNYTASVVRGLWAELGGRITGNDRQGATPSNARLLAQVSSPDLVDVIRDINKYSNNTMARQVFLSIGAKNRLPSDPDDAQAAYRVIGDWFARKGIRAPSLVMENGSGLSRNERITAREMATMLYAAWHSPYSAELMTSMPLAGMDGTLRKRFRSTELMGNAHLKTGTLNNVRALAGFTRDAQGNLFAVAAILNHPRPWGASAVLDQLLLDLYQNGTGR